MKIDITGSEGKFKWVIYASIRDTAAIRTIPGARARRKSNPGLAVWTVPATIVSAKQIHNTLNKPPWTAEARAHRQELTFKRDKRVSIIDTPGEEHQAFGGTLAGFQTVGVDFLMRGSGILADDMGLGKTVMASVAASIGGYNTVLILTTKSTLGVWVDHFNDWTSHKPFLFHGTKGKRMKVYEAYAAYKGKKALITSHGMANAHSSLASFGHVGAEGEPGILNEPFDLGIIDEVHKLGVNPKNKWVRAMWRIGDTCGTRWAITGTPINDVPDDLWVIMRFVDKTVLGADRGPFRDRYCIVTEDFFGGRTNKGIHPERDEEFQWAMKPYMLRRLKRTAMPDLPAMLPPQYITLPMSPSQLKAYKAMSKQMMTELNGELYVAPDVLSQHQACQYLADGIPVIADDGKVTHLEANPKTSNKLEFVLDIADERNGDPFVIYAESAKTARMMNQGMLDAGYVSDIIEGASSQDERDATVAMFQDDKLDVVVLTSAGAEGITLTKADLVVFVRESWRAQVNQQVRDRIDRWGQSRPPQIIVLMSEATVDLTRRSANVYKVDIQQIILKDKKRIGAFLDGSLDVQA